MPPAPLCVWLRSVSYCVWCSVRAAVFVVVSSVCWRRVCEHEVLTVYCSRLFAPQFVVNALCVLTSGV